MYPFNPVLPASAVVFDCYIRRVYKRTEYLTMVIFKITAWLGFYVILIMTSLLENESLYKLMNFLLVLITCAASAYSFLLVKCQALSKPLAPDADQYN